jgi:hypothetical protein
MGSVVLVGWYARGVERTGEVRDVGLLTEVNEERVGWTGVTDAAGETEQVEGMVDILETEEIVEMGEMLLRGEGLKADDIGDWNCVAKLWCDGAPRENPGILLRILRSSILWKLFMGAAVC